MPTREPAVWIGLIGSIVLIVAQQLLTSGIVTSDMGVQWTTLIISLVPLLTGVLTRGLVTPVKK